MAFIRRPMWVATYEVFDDSLGKTSRKHKMGIKYDTAAAGTDDDFPTVKTNVDTYTGVMDGITNGLIDSVSVSRRSENDAAPVWSIEMENERKAVFNVVSGDGFRGTLTLPSLNEALLETTGAGAGLFLDGSNAAVTTYLALVVNGNYCMPANGSPIIRASGGKKFHYSSPILRERVG